MADWKAFGRSKDLWSGIIFLALGCAAVALGRDHPMGTAMRMGPAYFPTMLGSRTKALPNSLPKNIPNLLEFDMTLIQR